MQAVHGRFAHPAAALTPPSRVQQWCPSPAGALASGTRGWKGEAPNICAACCMSSKVGRLVAGEGDVNDVVVSVACRLWGWTRILCPCGSPRPTDREPGRRPQPSASAAGGPAALAGPLKGPLG